MNTRFVILALTFLRIAYPSLAQTSDASLKLYKKAKKHYNSLEYEAAKSTLNPLISLEKKSATTPYALFYYALSAYHNQEPELAAATFSTIIEAFPDWEQIDEARYWLGQLSFEVEDYRAGLAWLSKMTEEALADSGCAMKRYFLSRIENLETLQALLKQYPEDRVISQVLFDKANQQPLIERNFDLLHVLERDFHLSLNEVGPLQSISSFKKDSYNVAVFFPFFVDELDYEEENNNHFIIALYQGIQVAVASLAKQGIKINLFAYDTKKDPVVTATLLEQQEVKGMDLIIGPLYPSTLPLVSSFAQVHQVNLFNPLSENAEAVGDNPFAFLFKSSLETQARKAAEFTLQNAEKGINVGIVYSTSKADVIKAHTYKQYIEQHTGKEVALLLPIAPEEAPNFLNAFRETAEAVEQGGETPSLFGLTHIYVASKDELVVANVLSVVEMMNLNPCIIGDEAWLQQSSLTFDQLQQLQLRFVAPNHINYDREGIYKFRSEFYDQFAQYPNHYACTGYEMMLFLGHMLAEHGVYFQKHWEGQLYKGAIFEGATYGIHHDNQHVPIVQLQGTTLVVCNQEILND